MLRPEHGMKFAQENFFRSFMEMQLRKAKVAWSFPRGNAPEPSQHLSVWRIFTITLSERHPTDFHSLELPIGL
jgi:hypothetical protein